MPKTILHPDDLPPVSAEQKHWPWITESKPQSNSTTDTEKLPKICIVTPSFNQGEYLEKTIRSILLQQYPKLQYIIIDGGSTDNSLEILEKYSHLLDNWVSEPDTGQSNAINKGFNTYADADCDIYMWLCSDDLLTEGALQNIGSYFVENPDCQWLCGMAAHLRVDIQDSEIEYFPAGLVDSNALSDFWKLGEPGRFVKQSSVAWRSELWHQIGGLREDLHLAMDHDLWLKFNEISPMHAIEPLISIAQLHDDCKSLANTKEQIKQTIQCCYDAYKRQGRSPIALTLRMATDLPKLRLKRILHFIKIKWYGGIIKEFFKLLTDPARNIYIHLRYC